MYSPRSQRQTLSPGAPAKSPSWGTHDRWSCSQATRGGKVAKFLHIVSQSRHILSPALTPSLDLKTLRAGGAPAVTPALAPRCPVSSPPPLVPGSPAHCAEGGQFHALASNHQGHSWLLVVSTGSPRPWLSLCGGSSFLAIPGPQLWGGTRWLCDTLANISLDGRQGGERGSQFSRVTQACNAVGVCSRVLWRPTMLCKATWDTSKAAFLQGAPPGRVFPAFLHPQGRRPAGWKGHRELLQRTYCVLGNFHTHNLGNSTHNWKSNFFLFLFLFLFFCCERTKSFVAERSKNLCSLQNLTIWS